MTDNKFEYTEICGKSNPPFNEINRFVNQKISEGKTVFFYKDTIVSWNNNSKSYCQNIFVLDKLVKFGLIKDQNFVIDSERSVDSKKKKKLWYWIYFQ
jgi:hypothetical protein